MDEQTDTLHLFNRNGPRKKFLYHQKRHQRVFDDNDCHCKIDAIHDADRENNGGVDGYGDRDNDGNTSKTGNGYKERDGGVNCSWRLKVPNAIFPLSEKNRLTTYNFSSF